MENVEMYGWLMNGTQHAVCDRFDAHVVASALCLAVVERTRDGVPVSAALGLGPTAVVELVETFFPHARPVFVRLVADDPPLALAPEEASLRALFDRYATEGSDFQAKLGAVVARRALRPHHLWQDLGLRNRRELSWLMERHFDRLAARNARDMKWKKFLYRTICRDGSFPICTAPSCGECDDYDACFGDEQGESLLPGAPSAGASGSDRLPSPPP